MRIVRVSGALVEARPLPRAALYELVRVGHRGLLGEVVRVDADVATVQVYEDTDGLALGEPIEPTGGPLMVELGPGLLGSVLDGLGRPLARLSGDFLAPGATAATLDATARWEFVPAVEVGARVEGGDVLGRVGVERILVPPGVSGTVATIEGGRYTVREPVGALADGTPLMLGHRWPLRTPRPVGARLAGDRPLVTGQRIFDFLFPVAEGGAVAVPGGFGTGKTVIEQSLARHAEADVVVYVGCGERGNEMADLLAELPALEDGRTGRPLSERTVLVVNTSNMPVAAREASVYLGFTLAEYFRDQGLRVAILADSLSRWAEAMRELGSRLRELPGEEGYPTGLANRLGALYERAGRATCLGGPERTGSVTFVSALSPPGGDLSEPVTQASLRVVGALWALDARLAHQRQFPAVDWEVSYTAWAERVAPWFEEHGGRGWAELRQETLVLLQRERELREVAELVGQEALEDADRLVLEIARVVREVVIGQNAFDPADAASPPDKTWLLAHLTIGLLRSGQRALAAGVAWEALDLGGARRALLAVRDAAASDRAEATTRAEAALAALGGAP
jgi:V/A-type H+-transporting ATPase subunit A